MELNELRQRLDVFLRGATRRTERSDEVVVMPGHAWASLTGFVSRARERSNPGLFACRLRG